MFNMIDSWMHPERGYEDASKKLKEGWDQSQNFQQPYNQAGMDQIGRLTGAEDKLLNPQQLQNDWASGYSTSPYAQYSMNQAKDSGLDAASSMGLGGSSAALNNIQIGAGNIMQKDRQQYMNDLMEKYKLGTGIGQNMYNQGAETGRNLGGQALQVGGAQGEAALGAANAPGEQMNRLANGALQALIALHGKKGG